MDEKGTNEEVKKENAVNTENAGSEPKAATLIDQANASAERMEKANERKTELLRQEEEILARRALGGLSEAGQGAQKPKEETPKEYNDRIEKEISEGKHGD